MRARSGEEHVSSARVLLTAQTSVDARTHTKTVFDTLAMNNAVLRHTFIFIFLLRVPTDITTACKSSLVISSRPQTFFEHCAAPDKRAQLVVKAVAVQFDFF